MKSQGTQEDELTETKEQGKVESQTPELKSRKQGCIPCVTGQEHIERLGRWRKNWVSGLVLESGLEFVFCDQRSLVACLALDRSAICVLVPQDAVIKSSTGMVFWNELLIPGTCWINKFDSS